MRFKATVAATFFIVSLFAGSAMAAWWNSGQGPDGSPPDFFHGVPMGQRGVPQQSPDIYPGQYAGGKNSARYNSGASTNYNTNASSNAAGPNAYTSEKATDMTRADALIGKTVVDVSGQDIGTVQNLLISESGLVEYVLISRGKGMSRSGDAVPVPWSAANLRPTDSGKLQASITKDQLNNAPAMSYSGNWSPTYEQQVDSYFGTAGPALEPLAPAPPAYSAPRGPIGPDYSAPPSSGNLLWRAK